MFTTFTGSSRRPRQVNLSGRNTNPFAAAQQKSSGTPHNTPGAVAQAQQERRARQQERERREAARRLQRTWRGYSDRQRANDELRAEWDRRREGLDARAAGHVLEAEGAEVLALLRMLVHFASPTKEGEMRRVCWFARCLDESPLAALDEKWERPLVKLARIVLAMIPVVAVWAAGFSEEQVHTVESFLGLLAYVARDCPDQISTMSVLFYSVLAELASRRELRRRSSIYGKISSMMITLLRGSTSNSSDAYSGFIIGALVREDMQEHLDLDRIAERIDSKRLAKVMRALLSPTTGKSILLESFSSYSLSWLLAYLIHIRRNAASRGSAHHILETDYIAVVTTLLSHLAGEIAQPAQRSIRTLKSPMPPFAHDEIFSLINQESVTGLLRPSDIIPTSIDPASPRSDEAAVLASYALTLLQVFSHRGDDIRLWLFLGSTSTSTNNASDVKKLPAIKFLWNAVIGTQVYQQICASPRRAVDLLRSTQRKQSSPTSQTDLDQQWRIVLLFLELYTFVLKVMDDEEFMNGGEMPDESISWTRSSALKLSDVHDLTIFLKNFAFSMYWHSADINGPVEPVQNHSLEQYFGKGSWDAKIADDGFQAQDGELVIAGIHWMTPNYLKGMVTGVLRMLYERDSRRSFLPKDHWLMKELSMDGFIPAVVTEQAYRNEHHEDDDDYDNGLLGNDMNMESDDEANLVGTGRTQQVRRIERLKRQQQKASKRKQLQNLTPRLEILQNMPFLIPFNTRVEIFREFVAEDQSQRRRGLDPDQWRMAITHGQDAIRFLEKHSATIHRDRVFHDAYRQFYELDDGLKEPIQITFVDQFDTPEAGIDGGGVTKEFLTSITGEAFTPKQLCGDFFVENAQHLLYPNPSAVDEHKDLLRRAGVEERSRKWNAPMRELFKQYEFLGRVIGKCLYEGILVDVHFARFFLVKWALTGGSGSATYETGFRPTINDLRDLDEELYQGLLKLKNYRGNVEDFSLDFTVTDTISIPADAFELAYTKPSARTETITRELRPDGANIPVTNKNRLVYISCMARHRLQTQPHLQTSAFLKGLSAIIQPAWLSMFNPSELQNLLSGDSSEIDVADLRRHTLYGGVYVIGDDGREHPTVQLFWDVMRELTDADRRRVLRYVTSTPRGPLLGFAQLNPLFSIRDSGSDQTRLPSASTCVNLLKLPIYRDKETLREKLIYAVNAGAGFDMS